MSYMYDYYNVMRQTNKLVTNIEQAINGEYSAIKCYAKLAKLAPNEEVKNQILEIRQDEMNHLQAFSQIYMDLTGRQPKPKVTEECPNQYIDGLEFALKDEQKAVDFYLEIADEAPNQSIKEAFRRAAADEQNHAVWFLYFLMKSK